MRDGDVALDEVADGRLAFGLGLEPDHEGRAFGRLLGIAVPPAAVVAHRQLGGALLGAHRLQFLGGREALIGVALLEQLERDLGMAAGARELIDLVAVPIEAEPAHAVEDRLDRRLRRARAIGVLDPQQEGAAVWRAYSQLNSAVRAPPMCR